MTIHLAYIIIGLLVLYYGGELLITGCLRVARHYRISPFIIGATVMGFGTSAPELAVSLFAAHGGSPEMAVGNVIGSNIANVGLVLGLTPLIVTLPIPRKRFRIEAPPLLAASFAILWMAWDMQLERWEGMVLLCGMAAYLWRALLDRDDSELQFEDEVSLFSGKGMPHQISLMIMGLVLLVVGARGMVEGGVYIARSMGISEWFIGISILAVGTSLPEIVSSLISARKGHGEMALGNVFGSNVFNILMVLGATATYRPMKIEEPIRPDLLITTAVTCVLMVLIKRDHNLDKKDGLILLTCYFAYLGLKAGSLI